MLQRMVCADGQKVICRRERWSKKSSEVHDLVVDRIALENGEAGAEVKILRLIEEQYSVNHLGDYKVHIPISTCSTSSRLNEVTSNIGRFLGFLPESLNLL